MFLHIVTVDSAAAHGSEAFEARQQRPPSEVLAALERWLRTVDEHEPGARDRAVATVRRWSGADLGALLAEGLLPLLRACDRPVRTPTRTAAGIIRVRPRDGMTAA